MSGESLRAAAALMRERAEAATGGPWVKRRDSTGEHVYTAGERHFVADVYTREDMRHIASWHPAVALAVADWLDDIATRHKASDDTLDLYLHYDSDEECEVCEGGGHPSTVCEGYFPSYEGMDGHCIYPCAETKAALAVAAAYLGTDA